MEGEILFSETILQELVSGMQEYLSNYSWSLLVTLCFWSFGPTFPAHSQCKDIYSLQEQRCKEKAISDI